MPVTPVAQRTFAWQVGGMQPTMRTKKDNKAAWERLFSSLSETNDLKFISLVRAISKWIESGKIPAGLQLPSTRELSQRLGIGRNTALKAISILVEHGYLISRQRSGVFVADISEKRPTEPRGEKDPFETREGFWEDRLSRTTKVTRRLSHFEVLSPSHIPFRGTGFDVSIFPISEWRECERAALGLVEVADWGRDMFDHDDPALVMQLRTRVLPRYGIWARPDEILVTLGSQEARYLIARLLGGMGVTVGLEEPGLPDMAAVFDLAGCNTKALSMDAQGAVPDSAMQDCDIVVLTPGHQFPTTAVMSLERRRLILAQAQKHDFIIVEDSIETELVNRNDGIPALKSLDHERVIFTGTLSRHLAPGLRIGYLVAAPSVIGELRRLRRLIHRHTPGNNQRALAIFLERAHYEGFLRRAHKELARRGELLLDTSNRYGAGVKWHHQSGAASFWCELPPGVDGDEVEKLARSNGITVESGAGFFHFKPPPHGFLRLSVACVNDTQIQVGIRKLMGIVARQI